ncbi:phospholipase effector Tle1 domain-containing protein [Citrobacter werkmanii]|uniref:phospholipase effector Tle1 domain-containing protein n=1 Tax=Citrobacter werkmanii TaxID=67827 RepID=UPI0026540AC5|nr:DUF2235 domain-containing protein [Citrobacter werkmanii]MDN8559111.1 DUF2235 domain-containing protein [Citrobacter werkmanii]
MSDAADSTLSTVKALVDAFKTGATPTATAAKSAESAYMPPPFPVPAKDKQPDEKTGRGRLPATKTLTEGNYARQCLEALTQTQADKAGGKPAVGCAGSLHISLFFDGTCCNQDGADEEYGSPQPALTNIGRLYHAANWTDQVKKAEIDGYFSYYFPGCGARFPDIGEDNYSLDGELFANGGEDRINQALLKTLSSIVYAVTKKTVEDEELGTYREQMATSWPFSMMTKNANRKSGIDAFCSRYLGETVSQWPRQPTRISIWKAQKRIPKIKLFVYGYCRGASVARAFARGLEALLDNTPMPLTAASTLPQGAALPSGPSLLGIPISIEFMGLMDSVSSVGVPHILPSATGHLGWAADSLQLPKTTGFVKSCYHFVAGHEQHGDLPLDSVRGPDGKYPPGAVEVVYPGVHADVGGDCKPTELGKVRVDSRSLLSQIALHDMYAAAFDAGAPLSVPKEVLPDGIKDKVYRVMQTDVQKQFNISDDVISLFNAWQSAGALQEVAKTASGAAKGGTVDEATIAALALAQNKDPQKAIKQAQDQVAKKEQAAKAEAAKAAAGKKGANAAVADKLPDPTYVPLKAKSLEVMLADQISWITAWRTTRFTDLTTAASYSIQPFYTQARNDGSTAQTESEPSESTPQPRGVPFIDKDRLDRAAREYHISHIGIMELLGQVSLDVIPTAETDQLGGKIVTAQESGYMQVKKSGDARLPALVTSPQLMNFYDNYVHDTIAKYNHDPLHSSLMHGYFEPRTIYNTDDDRWDSVKQFGQRIKAVININIGDIVTQAKTDMEDPKTVSGVLGKIYRDIKSGAFKTLLP